jgi:hypothetical protein
MMFLASEMGFNPSRYITFSVLGLQLHSVNPDDDFVNFRHAPSPNWASETDHATLYQVREFLCEVTMSKRHLGFCAIAIGLGVAVWFSVQHLRFSPEPGRAADSPSPPPDGSPVVEKIRTVESRTEAVDLARAFGASNADDSLPSLDPLLAALAVQMREAPSTKVAPSPNWKAPYRRTTSSWQDRPKHLPSLPDVPEGDRGLFLP